jgi:nucleotide-binding universal stress UspA family protein
MTANDRPNVLLFITTQREPQRAGREAIAAAKARAGELLVVAVLDPHVVDRITEALTENAFIGEKVTADVSVTVAREYRNQAEASVAAIVEQAEHEGVRAQGFVEEGDPTEICSRLARAHDVGIAFLVTERRSWLARLLSGSAVRTPELPGCEVRLLDDEDL